MFTYYKAVEKEEHMLFAKEIAKIYTYKNKNFTSQKISTIINGYIKEKKIVYEQLYFETKYGLCKVYPFSIYNSAMKWYIEKLSLKEKR